MKKHLSHLVFMRNEYGLQQSKSGGTGQREKMYRNEGRTLSKPSVQHMKTLMPQNGKSKELTHCAKIFLLKVRELSAMMPYWDISSLPPCYLGACCQLVMTDTHTFLSVALSSFVPAEVWQLRVEEEVIMFNYTCPQNQTWGISTLLVPIHRCCAQLFSFLLKS